jgi:hypothetical protein
MFFCLRASAFSCILWFLWVMDSRNYGMANGALDYDVRCMCTIMLSI